MPANQNLLTHPFTATFIRIKARQLCRRCDFSRSDVEDVQQEMRLYLLQKAHLFDPARGSVEAFVTRAINTWISMHLRYRGRAMRRESYRAVSLQHADGQRDNESSALSDNLLEEDGKRRLQRDAASSLEQVEQRQLLEVAMGKLTRRQRLILIGVAEEGVAATARAQGLSRSAIDKQVRQIRQRLRGQITLQSTGATSASTA